MLGTGWLNVLTLSDISIYKTHKSHSSGRGIQMFMLFLSNSSQVYQHSNDCSIALPKWTFTNQHLMHPKGKFCYLLTSCYFKYILTFFLHWNTINFFNIMMENGINNKQWQNVHFRVKYPFKEIVWGCSIQVNTSGIKLMHLQWK